MEQSISNVVDHSSESERGEVTTSTGVNAGNSTSTFRTAPLRENPNEQQNSQHEDETHENCQSENAPCSRHNDNFADDEDRRTDVKDNLLPNIVSFAQRLLPTVLKRLTLVECTHKDEDFGTSLISSSLAKNEPISPHNNLKSTGLEESDYEQGNINDIESSLAETIDVKEEYLPQSAALLISTLMKYSNRDEDTNRVPNPNGISTKADDFDKNDSQWRPLPRSISLENVEREAELLLESIRRDDLSDCSPANALISESPDREEVMTFSNRHKDMHRPDLDEISTKVDDFDKEDSQWRPLPRSRTLEDQEERKNKEENVTTDGLYKDGDDDNNNDGDESMDGDMARLSSSIAFLQHDLENAGIAYLEDTSFHDDGFGAAMGDFAADRVGEENSLVSRFRHWFNRGFIMEQKLLHSYMPTTRMNTDDGQEGGNRTAHRLSDNPVLIWSLAIMWAFVFLVLMSPKIADWVEEGDPGIIAEFVSMLFN